MSDLSQEELNEDMVLLGKGRYRSKLESSKAREAEVESKHGQRLMRSVLPNYTEAITTWQNTVSEYDRKARYQIDTADLPAKVIGYLAVKSVIDSISKKRPLSQVAIFLGARVEDELRCRFLCETNEEKAEGILLGAKRRKGMAARVRHVRGSMRHETEKHDKPEWIKWGLRDKLNMGLNMVELLRVTTGIIEYTYILESGKRNKHKPTRYVGATDELLKWIEDFNDDRELLEPFWLPTVEIPKSWTNVWDGAYEDASVFLPRVPFIKTTNMEYLRTIEGALPEPMEAVNLIQQTPYKVNDCVLDVMKWSWDANLNIGDIPNRKDEEFPPIPIDIKTNPEANREWRRQAAKIYDLNLSTKSRRLLIAKTLHLADKFKGQRFFYPSQVDFRGRVYNIPSFLTIQGNDPSRGLLEFYRPMRLRSREDARWLAIHGANTWGNDKVTLDEREQWAYDFASEAQKIADNPTEIKTYIDADKPWQFLAWCFEWAKWTREGKMETTLPVSMDATNNGLQILSLLMRDEHGAYTTNVAQTDIPQDIYGEVAELVKQKLEADVDNDVAKEWLKFGIDRKLSKRPTMVYPYGGTFYSCRAYVDEWYQDCLRKERRPNPFSENIRYRVTGYLSRHVWDSIHEVLDKPTQCMNWLKQVSEICSDAGVPVEWTTPTGFPVNQSYKSSTSQSVKTKIGGQATWVKFKSDIDELCRRSQRNGISPNFVHSLDASLLTKSVIEANKQGIYDFAMIHDSFGTHSNNCDLFGKILREQTSYIFKLDLLRAFRSELLSANETLEIPEPPEYGNFDPNEVVNSTYFFS